MKNHYTILTSLLFISFTIPIETKISIPKLPPRVSSFFSRNKDETIHKEFNNIKKLEIFCEHGNVSIETWRQPCVLVEFKKQGSDLFLQDAYVKYIDKDSTLQVTTQLKENAVSGTISLHILVPETLPVKVETTQGDIIITGLSGTIEAQTTNKSITVLQGTGTVIASTTEGNIFVQRRAIQQNSCLNLQSLHGDITVSIPQDLHCEVQAQSPYGKIYSELFVTLHPQTILLNDETFKKLKHYIHGSIGQSMQDKNEAMMILSSDDGIIKIIPYNSKKIKR